MVLYKVVKSYFILEFMTTSKLYCFEQNSLLRLKLKVFVFTSCTMEIPEWLERVGSNTLYVFKGSWFGIDDFSLEFIVNEDLINIF